MIKLKIKYWTVTSLLTMILTLTSVMAAEFVVQTDLDSGGGQIINEINPNVFTIDTLRSAVEQANDEVSFPGPDTIRFDENIVTVNISNTYTKIILSLVGDQFDFQNQSSDSALGIDSVITIQGTPAGVTELPIQLDADGLRHFQVNGGGKLRLQDLFLINGETPLNSAGRGGSVVVSDNGQLEISGCDFRFNDAVNGGAIAFQQDALDGLIENSSLNFNGASDENTGTSNLGLGGAIYTDSGTNSLIIRNASFLLNNADASGGAVYINRPFEILNSTFSDNNATGNGGALNVGSQAQFTISNTVFYDNLCQLRGGAIYIGSSLPNTGVIFNSTLAQNKAGFDLISPGIRGGLTAGAGIYSPIAFNLLMHNNIVANNQDTGTLDDVTAELMAASSFNLLGVDGEVTGISHNTNGNLIGTSIQPINPGLKLNSIFTAVVGLESNSPAVNSGSNAQVIVAGLNEDILGNDRIISTTVDRGAFESDVFFYTGFE